MLHDIHIAMFSRSGSPFQQVQFRRFKRAIKELTLLVADNIEMVHGMKYSNQHNIHAQQR